MTELKDLKIFIIDNPNSMASCLEEAFHDANNAVVKHYV